jgi:hypothetical protein
MAGNTTADSGASDLFQRKATGLLRGWSVWDGFIYAAFSINLITLGLYAFSLTPFFPDGALIWAIVLAGLYLVFQAITYASLIAVMPRAGGDYVWQSRILGGGIGFVLAVTGWWFILWHWVPIYADMLNKEIFVPLAAILNLDGVATFFGGATGLFTSCMIVAILASVLISLGMRTYARIQKICFYGGLVGLAIMLVVLLVSSHSDFVSAYNQGTQELFGAGGNAYQKTIESGSVENAGPTTLALGPTLLLIPLLAFFNLWSNWGATLYGEVRGASDFRKNIYAMGGALIVVSILALVMLLLFAKTFGWDFYYAANNAFWSGKGPVSAWPYPGLLAAMLFGSPVLQVILVALMSRHGVPVLHPGRLRHGLRPDASGGGLQDLAQRRPLRSPRAYVDTLHPHQLPLCVRRELRYLHARRHARHRDNVLGLGDRCGRAAVAEARHLQRVPDRPLQRSGYTADHRRGGRLQRVLALLPVQMDHRRDLRHQQSPVAHLHAGTLHTSARLVRRLQVDPASPGYRPQDGLQ